MGTMRPEYFGALALLLLGACAEDKIGDVRYALDQCQRAPLVNGATGVSIRGAEDFALDATGQRLFFSAYDRRAVEKAARKRKMQIPDGGVFSVTIEELFEPGSTLVAVAPLAAPSDVAGGLRPHGISFDARNNELVFINRTYQRMNGKWEMTPRLQRIGANGEMFIGADVAAPCAANDVLVTEQQVFTSFDHSRCDWRAGFERSF